MNCNCITAAAKHTYLISYFRKHGFNRRWRRDYHHQDFSQGCNLYKEKLNLSKNSKIVPGNSTTAVREFKFSRKLVHNFTPLVFYIQLYLYNYIYTTFIGCFFVSVLLNFHPFLSALVPGWRLFNILIQ